MNKDSRRLAKPGKADGLDLSRMRHELRTPINHILGYCEMLLEESQLPPDTTEELRRIHAGGRELQLLIGRYFEEESFFQERDLHKLYHELRTPVNHIVGYSDLLIEQVEGTDWAAAVPDLRKIRDAASNWLALMEAYLISPAESVEPGDPAAKMASGLSLNLGFTFKVPEAKSSAEFFQDEGAILIVDDDETSRDMLVRRLRRCGYTVLAVANGLNALLLARKQPFDLVLLDMIMPGLDGFQVLAKFKAEPALSEIPVIMLSALDEENGIARCIEMGAEDYLSKPFNPVFLRARIGACLEKRRLREKEKSMHAALARSQRQLASELNEAACYVRSLLPQPLSAPVEARWCFQPSQQLGGDAFGYHWIDSEHLAIYLLDVCGHGVGAALLSVSVLNSIRAHTLAGVDFSQPGEVLNSLNRAFPMETQNNLFFSLWYGVYRPLLRELRFASGGHPPALLLLPQVTTGFERIELRTDAPALGCFEEASYQTASQPICSGAKLLVFSDGVFEVYQGEQRAGTWQEFASSFDDPQVQRLSPAERLERAQTIRGAKTLEDDFSLVEFRFP